MPSALVKPSGVAVVKDNGKLLLGNAGDACCCGCVACGDTLTLTSTGITTTCGCRVNVAGSSIDIKWLSGSPNGTWTLTQTAACIWEGDATGVLVQQSGYGGAFGTPCDPASASSHTPKWVLIGNATGTSFTLILRHNFGAGLVAMLFYHANAANSCPSTLNFTNALASCATSPPLSGTVIGSAGSVSITI